MELILSGMIYLSVYTFTILVTHYAETKDKNKRRSKKTLLLLLVAIFIPCLLAGMRDISVGTDTAGYASKLMNYAMSSSSFAELRSIDRTYTEVGYQFIVYLITRATSNFGVLLFLTELLILLPYVYTIYILRNKISMTYSISVFMFCYYHISLNLMRQSIAMSLITLAFVLFVYKNKNFLSLLLVAIAFSIHRFTIVIVLILLLFWRFRKFYNNKKKRVIFISLMLCGLSSLEFLTSKIFPMFLVGYYDKFLQYISGEQGVGFLTILTSPSFLLYFFIFIFCWAIFNYKKLYNEFEFENAIFMISFFSVLCYFLQAALTFSNRITYFLLPYYTIFVSLVMGYRGLIKQRDKVIILYLCLIMYWLANCMLNASSSTAIYTTSF